MTDEETSKLLGSDVVKWGRPTRVYIDGYRQIVVVDGGRKGEVVIGDAEAVTIDIENVTIHAEKTDVGWDLTPEDTRGGDIYFHGAGAPDIDGVGVPEESGLVEIPHYVIDGSMGDVFVSEPDVGGGRMTRDRSPKDLEQHSHEVCPACGHKIDEAVEDATTRVHTDRDTKERSTQCVMSFFQCPECDRDLRLVVESPSPEGDSLEATLEVDVGEPEDMGGEP